MSIQDAYDAMVRDKADAQKSAINTPQSREWLDLPNMEDVARAKFEGWEIDRWYCDGWISWDGKEWYSSVKYRSRPKQPKPKTIMLRKALLRNNLNNYYTYESSLDVIKWESFVCWIGEPYDVEVPE